MQNLDLPVLGNRVLRTAGLAWLIFGLGDD